MGIAVATLLAAGQRLTMVNPRGAPLPTALPGANALFIDREGTGLSVAGAAALVAEASARRMASILRADGLAADELAACAALAPDAVVLPQIVSASELTGALTAFDPDRTAIIAQVETVEAVADLDALIAVPGVAGFLIGPNDLAHAMGHPGAPDHPDVAAAVDRVAEQLAGAGRAYGLPVMTDAARTRWTDLGAQLHYVPLDTFLTLDPTT